MRTYFVNTLQHYGSVHTSLKAIAVVSSMLTACGGTDQPAQSPTTEKETEQIVLEVANSISSNLGTNIIGAVAAVASSQSVSSFVDSGLIVQLQSVNDHDYTAADTATDIAPAKPVDQLTAIQDDVQQSAKNIVQLLLADQSGNDHEDSIQKMLLPTLGVGGTSLVTQDDNIITVVPDERMICDEWLTNTTASTVTRNFCTETLSHMSAEIELHSDYSGILSYLFFDEPLAVIEYSASRASYELNLGGVKNILDKLNITTVENIPLPDIMLGTIKLTATVSIDSKEIKPESMMLEVTDALHIADTSEHLNLELGAAKLLTISTNPVSGLASMAMQVIGLHFSASEDTGDAASPVFTLQIPAFTINTAFGGSNNTMDISNFGMANGPLTLNVGDTSAMQVSAPPFSLRLNEMTGDQEILEQLDLRIDISELSKIDTSFEANSSASYAVVVPANTVLQNQTGDVTKVISGGPILFDYELSDGLLNPSGSSSIEVGQCYNTGNDDSALAVAAACDE